MGNFGSKEDILSEIESLFKKMNNGKLTLDELEDLVSLSRELHERSVILRYKAFEEKIFGERPVVVEVPKMEAEPEVREIPEEIEESVPAIEADDRQEELEEETEHSNEEGPSFEIEVKPTNEPVFGFSLFGDDEDEKEESVQEHQDHSEPVVQEIVDEEEPLIEELEESIDNSHEEEEWSSNEIVSEESTLEIEDEIEEPVSNMAEEVVEEPATRPMSEVERAHAENLARFFNKSQTQEAVSYEAPIETTSSFNSFETAPSQEVVVENNYETEELEEENETPVYEATEASIEQEEEIDEPQSEPTYFQEEKIEEVPVYSNNSAIASSIFVHKFNQVSSDLASSQFGLVKLDSLLGSFGLNERLQFINELFDGSSEGFSNAIKHLDQQASSEHAKTKVAEYAVENNWDVESETVVEFMQKIVRRYA